MTAIPWSRGRFAPLAAITGTLFVLTAAPAVASVGTATTLTSSAASLTPSQQATLTATIGCATATCAPNGSQGSVHGSPMVTFTNTTNQTVIATVPVSGRCAPGPKGCTVSATISGAALSPGSNTILAAYAGQPGEAPSGGSTVVSGAAALTGPFLTTCLSTDGSCDTGTQNSPDGTGSVDISTPPPSAGAETISGGWSNQALPCSGQGTVDPTPTGGNVAVFNVTNSGGQKTITYIVFGSYAVAAAQEADPQTGMARVCYESLTPFTDAAGNPAQLDPATGLYFGVLPVCQSSDSGLTVPCVQSTSSTIDYDSDDPDGDDSFTAVIIAPAGDPRTSY